ncbi:MAG TPA: hypothetical protein VGR61_06295 [Candidatus Dormibacteraeota bacterium]|nr:hypothetical protein [Candidatus Dormibacteraeota bacterium]
MINHGHFEYILDDAYIHLSMARNLATSGTYGVVAGSYESASSSPAWTVLLALGGSLWPLSLAAMPLVFNILASAMLLWVFWGGQDLVRPARRLSIPALALAALLPLFLLLPSLTLTGMEAIVHALFALVILRSLLVVVAGDADRRGVIVFLALVAVSVLVRLEDMFLALGCGLAIVLFGRGRLALVVDRLKLATAVGVAAATPAAAIALVNLGFGQSWLPNSVISKSALFDRAGLPLVPLDVIVYRLQGDPLLCVLLAVSFAYVVRCAVFDRSARTFPAALAFAVTAVLHLALATLGWYDRYQEYLVVMGVWLLFRYAVELAPDRRRVLAAAAVLALLLVSSPRKAILTIFTATASNNIYLQQHEMGVFLARYYDGKGAVINDLGEVSYQHHGPLLDMFGLGSYQVLKARRGHQFDASFVDSRTRAIGAPVAVIYSEYWKPQIPAGWKLVGSWTVLHAPGNLGGAKVDFWATSTGSADELRNHLAEYRRELPDGVKAEVY